MVGSSLIPRPRKIGLGMRLGGEGQVLGAHRMLQATFGEFSEPEVTTTLQFPNTFV